MKDRLKELRKTLKLTQVAFASKIGMKQSSYTNYEAGKSNPSKHLINNICKTFGVSETWLCNGEGEMFAPKNDKVDEIMKKLNADESLRRIAEIFFELPDEAQQAFGKFAEQYIERYNAKYGMQNTEKPEPEEKPDAVTEERDQWGRTAEDYHRVQSIEDEMRLEKEKKEKSGA